MKNNKLNKSIYNKIAGYGMFAMGLLAVNAFGQDSDTTDIQTGAKGGFKNTKAVFSDNYSNVDFVPISTYIKGDSLRFNSTGMIEQYGSVLIDTLINGYVIKRYFDPSIAFNKNINLADYYKGFISGYRQIIEDKEGNILFGEGDTYNTGEHFKNIKPLLDKNGLLVAFKMSTGFGSKTEKSEVFFCDKDFKNSIYKYGYEQFYSSMYFGNGAFYRYEEDINGKKLKELGYKHTAKKLERISDRYMKKVRKHYENVELAKYKQMKLNHKSK